MYKVIYYNMIYNYKVLKTEQMPQYRKVVEKTVVHTYNTVLCRDKKRKSKIYMN